LRTRLAPRSVLVKAREKRVSVAKPNTPGVSVEARLLTGALLAPIRRMNAAFEHGVLLRLASSPYWPRATTAAFGSR
jgi:hypothetical protein